MHYTITTPASTGRVDRVVQLDAERLTFSARADGTIKFKFSPQGPEFKFHTRNESVGRVIRALALSARGYLGRDPATPAFFQGESPEANPSRITLLRWAREWVVGFSTLADNVTYSTVRWMVLMVLRELDRRTDVQGFRHSRYQLVSSNANWRAYDVDFIDTSAHARSMAESRVEARRQRNAELARLLAELARDGDVIERAKLRRLVNEMPWDEDDAPDVVRDYMTRGTCGHWEWNDNLVMGDNDVSCCQNCYRIGEYRRPADRPDNLYNEDDLYYSENADDYLTYDDSANDDDDDDARDPHTGGVYDWGVNALEVLNEPEITSKSDGDFTIGMEFECEPNSFDTRSTLAEHVRDTSKGTIMCKNDGSLSSMGIELVFAPLTLESTKKAWRNVKFPLGTQAWNARSCGMHVHVDSRAFTRLSLAKFVAFWNHRDNAALIRSVAGRHSSTDSQAHQYAASFELDPTSVVRTLKKSGISENRYRCVNLTTLSQDTCERLGVNYETRGHHQSYNTVEVRVFRASLKPERTLAQLEMVHASVEFARQGSTSDMTEAAFREWLKRNGARYPHLRAWLDITRAHKLVKDGVTFTETERV